MDSTWHKLTLIKQWVNLRVVNKKPQVCGFLLFFFPIYIWASELFGVAIHVQDGDSLILLTPTYDQVRIRLAEIDAPEKKQPYGQKSKEALADLVAGKQITAQEQTIDRYGRVVAHVYVDGIWVNAELVRNGAAWLYRKYSKTLQLLDQEEAAKNAKRGLWALPEGERVPPWEWRKTN